MYKFNSRVRFSESDKDSKIKIGNIINYMQDCSTFDSEELGAGLEYLKKKNRAWIIVSWNIEIDRYPRFGENIVVKTMPYAFNSRFGFRNFIIEDENNNILVKADSKWALVDVNTGKLCRLEQEDTSFYKLSEKIPMSETPKRICEPDNMETKLELKVSEGLLDSNNHMNNEKYIEIALNCMPKEHKIIKKMHVEYRKSAIAEDIIVCKIAHTDDNSYYVSLNDIHNNVYAIVKFIF